MKIVYPEDAELKKEYASLTYGEFRGMFPKPAPAKLPRPERLIRYGYTEPRLLAVSDKGFSITVYRDGVCLYQEEDRGSVCSVQECEKIRFSSVTAPSYLTEEATASLAWYFPIYLVASEQWMENRESREEYQEKTHYDAGSLDMLTETHSNLSATRRTSEDSGNTRISLQLLRKARKKLTGRQDQILTLRFQARMTQAEIAEALNTSQSKISLSLRRAIQRLKKFVETP